MHFSTTHNITLSIDNDLPISASIPPSSFSLDVEKDNSSVSEDNNLPTSMIYGPTMPPSIKDNVYEKSSATYFNDNIKSTTKALSGIVSRAFHKHIKQENYNLH